MVKRGPPKEKGGRGEWAYIDEKDSNHGTRRIESGCQHRLMLTFGVLPPAVLRPGVVAQRGNSPQRV